MTLKNFTGCVWNGISVMNVIPNFSEKPPFKLTPSWKTQIGRSNLEVFLGELEKKAFIIIDSLIGYFDLNAIREVLDNRKNK